MYVTTNNKNKKGREFEREQGGINGGFGVRKGKELMM